MKSIRIPLALLALLLAGFVYQLIFMAGALPERVASHFDGAGRPNGWMSRDLHIALIAGIGIGIPFLMIGILFLARFMPVNILNIPNREYWTAPERRVATHDYLLRHGLWFGCMMIGFIAAINHLVLLANRQNPPHLPAPQILGLVGIFAAGILAWSLGIIFHFRRIEDS